MNKQNGSTWLIVASSGNVIHINYRRCFRWRCNRSQLISWLFKSALFSSKWTLLLTSPPFCLFPFTMAITESSQPFHLTRMVKRDKHRDLVVGRGLKRVCQDNSLQLESLSPLSVVVRSRAATHPWLGLFILCPLYPLSSPSLLSCFCPS